MPGISIVLKYPKPLFLFNRDVENVSENSVLRNCLRKDMQNIKTMLDSTKFSENFHSVQAKMMTKSFRRGISVLFFLILSFVLSSCTGSPGLSLTSTQSISPFGEILLQRTKPITNDVVPEPDSAGFFELKAGWSEPHNNTSLNFDPLAIKGWFIAASPDQRYLIFSPNSLVDTKTGSITLLNVGTDKNPSRIIQAAFLQMDKI